MLLMAVPIAIAFYTTCWSYLCYGLIGDSAMASGGQQLGLRTSNRRKRGVAITDRVAAPKAKYNNPKCWNVAIRYNSRLPMSMITFRAALDNRIGLLWGERAMGSNRIQFHEMYNNKRIWMYPIQWHMKRVFKNTMEIIIISSRDSKDPRGYWWMNHFGTFKWQADSACI